MPAAAVGGGPPFGLNTPVPDFPVIGNYAPVAFLFLAHMVVAQYSLGAITLSAPMELWALRRGGDERGRRYARALVNSYYLVFSLGATLGVFAVTMLIGLWGRLTGTLVNEFLPVVGVAFGLFVILAPLLAVYRNTWDRMSPGRHCALGFAVLFWQTLFLVCIVVLDADMITPGSTGWFGGFTDVAAYWPLLIHRLIGNVSWTALFLACVAVVRLMRSEEPAERAFQSWAGGVNLRIGIATALVMPPVGFVLIEVLRSAQPAYYHNLLEGQAAWLMVVQALLLGIVLVGANVALATEEALWRHTSALARGCIAVAAGGMVLGVLPAQVLDSSLLWVRYAGIGAALCATAVHLVARSTGGYRAPRLAMAPGAMRALPYSVSTSARTAVAAIGATAVALSLFMGYIKDETRGQYATFGELTQSDAHQRFAPSGIYP